jgi:phage gp46-like protein
MPDIRLIDNVTPAFITLSWLLQPASNLPDETQALADAVLVAFNTDAQADVNEKLPDPRSDDRRGWWGDLDAQKIWNGWPIGSKLWLLRRAKIVDQNAREGATIARCESYIRECLQPFIDNQICSAVDVSVVRGGLINVAGTYYQPQSQPAPDEITAIVTIYRGPLTAIQLQFKPLWDEATS